MGFFGENGVVRKFLTRKNFYVNSKITVFCRLIILVVFISGFLRDGNFSGI